MKTKLQIYSIALCVGLFGFVNAGKATNVTYTYTGGGHPESLSNWGKTTSSIGSHPTSFTVASTTYEFKGVGSATMGANWTVTGANSKIQVGDAVNAFTLSDGAFTLNTVGIDVDNHSTFTISNTNDALGTGSAFNPKTGSTVIYATAAGTQSIFAVTYANLTISGSASMSMSGLVTVNGVLTINSGNVLILNSNELDLNGTIAGAGTITGDASASIIFSAAAGAFGTINFTSGGQQLLQFSTSACAATAVITLGSNLTVIDDLSGLSLLDLSSGTLSLNGHTLISDVSCVTVNLGGTVTGSSTSVLQVGCASGGSIGGSLMMDQTTAGTTNALSNLTLNDASGSGLTLGSALSIIDSICPTAGTIDASVGSVNLVFTSATKTGRVGQMSSTGALSGSTITSNIQRPGGNTGWVLMGFPGITATSFSAYGTQFPITCPSGCPNGSDAGFTSIDSWSETAALDLSGTTGFTAISTFGDAASNGTGYWFYMGQTSGTTVAIPIALTGAIQSAATTAFSLPVTDAHTGSNLVANPLPSPISWAAIQASSSNIATSYQVFTPNFNNGDYVTYTIGSGDPDGFLTDIIAQGQGFYVQASGGSPSLSVPETAKRNGGSQALVRLANPTVQSAGFNFFQLNVTGSGNQVNSTTFAFNPNALTGSDIYDAKKMPAGTAGALAVSSSSYGVDLAVNANPALTQNYAIPVKMITGTTGSYLVNPTNMTNMPSGGCIILHDNYTGTNYDLRAGSFNVMLNDTETVARFVLNITILPLTITTNTKQASCNNTHDGLITAVGNDAGPWNYTWKNASGTVVKTSLNKATADTLNGLNNGVYNVNISTVGTCNSATQTYTLTAPSAPTSAFTVPTSVNVGANVNFVNNSTNATNYIWKFGNGSISSQQTPIYAYNMPGTYTVTLEAIIAGCNDTVSSTQIVQVDATTGIKQVSGSGDITLSRDGNGNYLQFDYGNQTKVNIAIYNILGQNLLNNAGLTVVNDRIYLNINGGENQVLYVTITNLNNNQQTTKKFVND